MNDDWRDIATTPDDPNGLRGKRVLVMGLGLLGGGVAAARYAVSQGAAEVTVTDLRSEEMLAESVARLAGLPIRYVLGRHDPDDFRRADVVVRNPNVKRNSPYLAIAREAGKRIEMEIAWFFRACPGKIAGVTGTRGKSTTTLLLHHILEVAGWNPLLGGNLGGIETVSLLPEITPDRWTVLELGNWMLEGLHTVAQPSSASSPICSLTTSTPTIRWRTTVRPNQHLPLSARGRSGALQRRQRLHPALRHRSQRP